MLLDELAIKYQQESNEHREQIKTMTRQHEAQVEQLNKQIEELTVRTSLSLSSDVHVSKTSSESKLSRVFTRIR